MIRLLLLFALTATPAFAQDFCFCLRCTIGTHRSFAPQTEAMTPTVPRGLCTVSERLFPGTASPVPGDVVLYMNQTRGDVDMGRVVALAGARVQMIGGQLHLDGEAVATAPLPPLTLQRRTDATGARPTCPADTPVDAASCTIAQIRETLPNGTSYAVLDLAEGTDLDDTAPFTVPPDHVFILGDHRDLARDSRVDQTAGGPGFVALGDILGVLESPAPYLERPE
ncbi:signal peptidase I [Boseongicola sp. H5]|uniref:signal peptidase I n=1 Tax=Boseongicola sp. H5 TaxID=2763261 RepID=UPI001D0B20CF|nr:signal peptidase I [Boseongicola sp. H5]